MGESAIRGTVTFLITDVEGSTRRWADDADAMSEAMARHDALLRRAVSDHGGEVFKHTGDGICAVFPTANGARAAAEAAQDELALPVRIGLHTGVAEQRDGDWFGTEVNRAARIADAANGGQIVCSRTTAALLEDRPTLELGRFRLKGLDQPETIFQLGTGSFPSLRAGATTVHLPAPGTDLVGRDDLLHHVAELLGSERMVTLLGPGGVGKTRLAVEAARRMTGAVDRITFVDLTAADDAAGMIAAFARSLEVRLSTTSALVGALSTLQALLVVDNCEHLVNDVAELLEEVLDTAAEVRVLATSREVLEIADERVVPVPPLEADDDLIAVFVRGAERAGTVMDAVDREQVLALCRRLDGLPLAIELAASRTNVFTVGDLLDRLDDRLQLLATGRRRSRDRHRTMQATIAWSHALLDEHEKRLYAQLSAYADWFDLDDACAVCGLSEYSMVDGVAGLLSKSLLTAEERTGRRHYRFLESIRDHALEQLRTSGDHCAVMDAMASRIAHRIRVCADAILHDDNLDALDELRLLGLHQQHAARWALDQHDLELGRTLVEPYLELLSEVFHEPYAPAQGFVEAAKREGTEPDPVMFAVDVYERVYRLERGVWRPALAALEARHGSLEELPPHARMALWFAAVVVGDEETALRLAGVFAEVGHPHTNRGHEPTPSEEELADRIRSLNETEAPRIARAADFHTLCFQVQEYGRPDLWADVLAQSESALAWLPHWSDIRTQLLCARAELQRKLDDPVAAARTAETAIRVGRHRGVYGNMVPPLVTLLVLAWDLDLPELASTLRGRIPRRWSIYFQAERDAVNKWCDSILDKPARRRLIDEGRAMDLLELVERSVDEIERAATPRDSQRHE
ncbi:MAG: adenylate/guanylate cyclase domain-containing protein [Acidimicrobiales bacterium]|nr:adenylate/guanylate cyclase domain-containing protein [Acidimicrobiales bacterium]